MGKRGCSELSGGPGKPTIGRQLARRVSDAAARGGRGGRGGARRGSARGSSQSTVEGELVGTSRLIGPIEKMIIVSKFTSMGPRNPPCTCAICNLTEGATQFCDVVDVAGTVDKFPTACGKHLRVFLIGWASNHTWTQFVVAYHANSDMKQEVDDATLIVEQRDWDRKTPFNVEQVMKRSQTGWEMISDYVLITPEQYIKDIAPHESITPQIAGERVDSYQDEYLCHKVTGVLARDPSGSYLKLKHFARVFCDSAETLMGQEDHIRRDQGQEVCDHLKRMLREDLPIGARGNVDVPTIAELRARAMAAGNSLGISAAASANPGGASSGSRDPIPTTPPPQLRVTGSRDFLAILDGEGDGTGNDFSLDDTARSDGGASSRAATVAPCASPPSNSPTLVTPQGTESRAGNYRRRWKGMLKEAMQTSVAEIGEHPDMTRMKVLEQECNWIRLLDWDEHKLGDRLYALERFTPSDPAVMAKKASVKARVAACKLVGGSKILSCDPGVLDQQLKVLKLLPLGKATNWSKLLIKRTLMEDSDPDMIAARLAPWHVEDEELEFKAHDPRVCGLQLSTEDKIVVSEQYHANEICARLIMEDTHLAPLVVA